MSIGPSWDSPTMPRWRRLGVEIAVQIRSATLKPGDQLPSADALAEQHGVSRSTVLRTLSWLQSLGVLRGEQGVGVFVTDRLIDSTLESLLAAQHAAGGQGSNAPDPQLDEVRAELSELRERVGVQEAYLIELYGRLGQPYPGAGQERPKQGKRKASGG